MHIACIVRRLDRSAGVERHALSVGRELKSLGHHVVFYTFFYDKERLFTEFRDIGPVVALNQPIGSVERDLARLPFFNYFSRMWFENRRARALGFLIDPATDVLNPYDQLTYRVAAYFKKQVKNVPSVWMMDDMPTRRFGQMRSEACGGSRPAFLRRMADRILDSIEFRRFIRAQDRTVVLDERDREWVKTFFGRDAQVIRAGVNVDSFSCVPRTQVSPTPMLLMTGIFFPHRRFEDALQALSLLHARGIYAKLSIVGDYRTDDSYARYVMALIRKLHLEESVTLLGRVSDEKLAELYRTADMFLFPNHLQSWGLAVFEALASGLPAIVSTSAGASEVLRNRETALLVPPKDPERLAEAVVTLCEDSRLYATLSTEGKRLISEEMTWDKSATQLEQLLLEVCEK